MRCEVGCGCGCERDVKGNKYMRQYRLMSYNADKYYGLNWYCH